MEEKSQWKRMTFYTSIEKMYFLSTNLLSHKQRRRTAVASEVELFGGDAMGHGPLVQTESRHRVKSFDDNAPIL